MGAVKGTVIMMFQNNANDVHLLGFNGDLQDAGQELEGSLVLQKGIPL